MPMEPFVPDAEVSITAAEKWVQILPGAKTRVWSYHGELVSGAGVTVQNLVPDDYYYLGPILRVKTGTKVRILFHNNLPEDSVIHSARAAGARAVRRPSHAGDPCGRNQNV